MTASTASSETAGRLPLMAGNWKMNLNHLEAIAHTQKLAFALADKDYDAVEVAVLPPSPTCGPYRPSSTGTSSRSSTAPRTSPRTTQAPTPARSRARCSPSSSAPTSLWGTPSAAEYHAETDEQCNAKVKAAFRHGLTPILCVGEGLDIRKAGDQVAYTLAQLDGGLKDVPAEQAETIVIAYEPVWAIGTGEVATPEDAQEVCGAIRGRLAELYSQELAYKVRIQYGGSVKSGNVAAIMAQPDVDGALVGGAALDAEEFVKIVRFRDQ